MYRLVVRNFVLRVCVELGLRRAAGYNSSVKSDELISPELEY